jgi:acyl-CoA synthetase (AMP-forming)/AMP-acid ligase II
MSDRTFNLADLFEVVVDEAGDRVAVVGGDRRLTFAELDERASRFANHVLELGVAPETRVGIYAWNRAEWIETLMGALKARAVPINLNYRYTADELAYVLDDADVEVLVYEPEFAPIVSDARVRLPKLRHLLVLDEGAGADPRYEDALRDASPNRSSLSRTADDLYMLYTGGTTGMPKGVVWRHEDVFFAAMGGGGFGQAPIQTADELAERVGPVDSRMVAMVIAPLMHGAAQWGAFIMLYAGGTVVLNTDHHFEPHAIWKLVEHERATTVMVVGDAMARPLAEALEEPGISYDTSSVLAIGSGGAVFSPTVKQQLQQQVPTAAILDTIGASEVGSTGSAASADGTPKFMMRPDNTVLGDDLRPVEPGSGQVGRLARSGHIPLRYHRDEAKTAATFITDPDGVRWAIPGDFATIEADGTIVLLGRGSQCINSGGEKIYPEEVESALKSHPDVFDALVVGIPDERFGQRVAAVVHPRDGATPELDQLAEHCRKEIAGYKVPRDLALVGAISRTPAGKPDYAWARERFAASSGTT